MVNQVDGFFKRIIYSNSIIISGVFMLELTDFDVLFFLNKWKVKNTRKETKLFITQDFKSYIKTLNFYIELRILVSFSIYFHSQIFFLSFSFKRLYYICFFLSSQPLCNLTPE